MQQPRNKVHWLDNYRRHNFCCMFCTNCVRYICKPYQILLESWAVVSFPSYFLYNNILTFCPHIYYKVALPPPSWSFNKHCRIFSDFPSSFSIIPLEALWEAPAPPSPSPPQYIWSSFFLQNESLFEVFHYIQNRSKSKYQNYKANSKYEHFAGQEKMQTFHSRNLKSGQNYSEQFFLGLIKIILSNGYLLPSATNGNLLLTDLGNTSFCQ